MNSTFRIELSPRAVEDLKALRAYDRARLFQAIERHLTYQPTRISKSRIKRMAQPFWSQFRLRVDEFRVYYDVDEPAAPTSQESP